MKKIMLSCFMAFYVTAISAQTDTKAGIQFFKGSWDELLDSAHHQNKMIFIDVYTDWCGPCKYMDKFIFTKQTVGKKYNAARGRVCWFDKKARAEIGEIDVEHQLRVL